MKRIITVLLSLALFACTEQEPASPLTVNTEGNHYHNAYFGVSVEMPEGWYSQPAKETIALQQRGTRVLAGDEKAMQAMLEASLKSSVPLFGFFEVMPGTPNRLNPNVMAVAENLEGFPGIKTGCDYLEHVKKLMRQGKLPYQFEEGCQTRKLKGGSMDYFSAHLKTGTVKATQRYYATMKDHYALAVVQTYFDESGEKKTKRVLDSLVIE